MGTPAGGMGDLNLEPWISSPSQVLYLMFSCSTVYYLWCWAVNPGPGLLGNVSAKGLSMQAKKAWDDFVRTGVAVTVTGKAFAAQRCRGSCVAAPREAGPCVHKEFPERSSEAI